MTRFERWVASWLDMICGFLGVVTLNQIKPWVDKESSGYSRITKYHAQLNEVAEALAKTK